MLFGKSKLQKALASAQSGNKSYAESLEDVTVKGRGDAEALAAVLAEFRPQRSESVVGSDLHALAGLFQDAEDAETARHLRQHALPHLVRIYDQAREIEGFDSSDLLFLLKIFAMYQDEAGTERVIDAARRFPAGYLWSVIFGQFDAEHPLTGKVVSALADPLPTGFCAIAYLDMVNALAIAGALDAHPFDSARGIELLRGWLENTEPGEESYAHSATAALPFLTEPTRSQLMTLALGHRATHVRMEAAWALARLGQRDGIEALVRWCDDPRTAWRASEYLRELDREAAIPEAATQPDFIAMAEMCQWLEHPSEFGAAPDTIELVDTRELYWPPTDDRRRFWVFRYGYKATEEREADVGHGLVGSVTFALFGETTAELRPLEIYALHCCWELQCSEDPRAPEERSVSEGLALLRKHNPALTAELPS